MENTLWLMPTNAERGEESMKSLLSHIVLQPAVLKVTETLTSGLRWTLFMDSGPDPFCGDGGAASVQSHDFICFSLVCQCATTNLTCFCSWAVRGKHVVTPWREVCVCVQAGEVNLWNNNTARTVKCFSSVCDWVWLDQCCINLHSRHIEWERFINSSASISTWPPSPLQLSRKIKRSHRSVGWRECKWKPWQERERSFQLGGLEHGAFNRPQMSGLLGDGTRPCDGFYLGQAHWETAA